MRAEAHEARGDGFARHVLHGRVVGRDADIREPLEELVGGVFQRRGGHRGTARGRTVRVRERRARYWRPGSRP